MPAITPNQTGGFTCRYRDKKGIDKKHQHKERLDAELDLLLNAGPLSLEAAARDCTCAGLIQWFERRQLERGVKAEDLPTTIARLKMMLEDALNLPINEVTRPILTAARAKMWTRRWGKGANDGKRKYRPSTIEATCGSVRTMFRLAKSAGIVRENPASKFSARVLTGVPSERASKTAPVNADGLRYPSDPQFAAMTSLLPIWDEAGFRLVGDDGISKDEANGLAKTAVNYLQRKIRLTHVLDEGKLLPMPNGSQARVTDLTDKSAAVLLRLQVVRRRGRTFFAPGREDFVLPVPIGSFELKRLYPEARMVCPEAMSVRAVGSAPPGSPNMFTFDEIRNRAVIKAINAGRNVKYIEKVMLGRETSASVMAKFKKFFDLHVAVRIAAKTTDAYDRLLGG